MDLNSKTEKHQKLNLMANNMESVQHFPGFVRQVELYNALTIAYNWVLFLTYQYQPHPPVVFFCIRTLAGHPVNRRRSRMKSICRSQTRLRYIADRVLQSSSDMFQKNKDETRHSTTFWGSGSKGLRKEVS